MKDKVFKSALPNYKKKVLEVIFKGVNKKYFLPFSAFHDLNISSKNKFVNLTIDKETGGHTLAFVLEDRTKDTIPSDFVLYHCEPKYDFSALNQAKNRIKKAIKEKISIRTVADIIGTSPTQVLRILSYKETNNQLARIALLAELVGYHLKIDLVEKDVA